MSKYSEYLDNLTREENFIELAAAPSQEEFNQSNGFFKRAPASRRDFIPFDESNYLDVLEYLGHSKMRTTDAKLYRMAEGI